ncbi:hypothetical protein CPB83DRAFT_898896 [Crepidotus variabilis]|uniref:Uncharacterized protein n=1 Tax=Crepidotus variabilis TaxID=179855 RepID=A0A9P6E6B0_9AGAR|nr:hypothetical protein CPB83DRAFT_898896 [Crepidotus variabilis]
MGLNRRKLREDLLLSYAPKQIDCPTALKDASKHNDPPLTFAMQLAPGIRVRSESAVLDQETRVLQIEEILALHQEKDELLKKISPTWFKIRLCDTILSIFRRVPLEILQEIAIYAQASQSMSAPR